MNECEANYYNERVVRPGFCRNPPQPNNLQQVDGLYYLLQLRRGPVNQDYRWPWD